MCVRLGVCAVVYVRCVCAFSVRVAVMRVCVCVDIMRRGCVMRLCVAVMRRICVFHVCVAYVRYTCALCRCVVFVYCVYVAVVWGVYALGMCIAGVCYDRSS